MICFPNCKINLGLYVTARRGDGFHDLETVFYPVDWCDALEVVPHPEGKEFELQLSGSAIDVPPEKNILYKTWSALKAKKKLPPVLAHLLKKIPMGAGLGGGSSDAAFFLQLLNTAFSLQLSSDELHKIALDLGSDCPFFLENKPMIATGRGEILSPISINLSDYYIALVFPDIHSNTASAFSGISPRPTPHNLREVLSTSPEGWKDVLLNDFEPVLFKQHPSLAKMKAQLYEAGALYASMSGSGSTLYGIFESAPDVPLGKGHTMHVQAPRSKIL